MSTSGAGFGLSGLLQGFAQSYTAARVRATQMEVEQRHQLAGTLMQLYPNARPEAQQDIAQRLLTIYSTPPGKKLDKKLTDIGTLGQAAVQGGNAAGAQAASAGTAAGQAGAASMPPPPATGAAGGPIASDAAAPPPASIGSVPGASPQAALAGGPAPIPAPPPYSPFLSPAEKNQQTAAAIAAQKDAEISAQIAARDRYLQSHPDADPAELSMALGHTLPMWALNVKVPIKGVLGSDLLQSNPDIRTQSGQPLDPTKHYDIGVLAGKQFAMPTGIGTENIQSEIANRKGTLDEKISEFKTTDAYRKWKTVFDANNRMAIAKMRLDATQNKAPAALMQTAVFAKGGLERIEDAMAGLEELERKGVLGSVPQNKIEDWIFGKGLVDPSLPKDVREVIGKTRAAMGYTSSAAMRAHTGRTSREIYDDFKTRLGMGQDLSALRGAMDETKSMLTDYAQSASDANIRSIRAGTNIPTPPKPKPSKPPNGATHIGTSNKDGKDHYLDAAGKDLGPVT